MECHASKSRLIGLLILAVVLVGAAWLCTRLPGRLATTIGWIGVVFFGLCLAVIAAALFRTGPHFVVDDEGIWSRRLQVGVIRWQDIQSLSIGTIHNNKFLCIVVKNPDEYLCRAPLWQRALLGANRALGVPPLVVSLAGLTPGLEEVWSYLHSRATGKIGGAT